MQETLSITTTKPVHAALEYEALRNIGISEIEQTGSGTWTDYNVHDPGITTLELLCYALTDLGYRSQYDIPDLLAAADDPVASVRRQFFSARSILPNKPVTLNDYRKLLIDIEGVKNAWLQLVSREIYADQVRGQLSHNIPVSRRWQPVAVKGYYNVLLEFDTTLAAESESGVTSAVRHRLMQQRNLCEDFLEITKVEQQPFRLCGELEIRADAEPFDLLAQLFFRVQQYLTPLISFYSLADMQSAGYESDRIFEGPALENGFIKDEELLSSELRTEIHLSDVMREILDDGKVINILELTFNAIAEPAPPNKWVIPVLLGRQPRLQIEQCRVVLYKEGNPFRPDLQEVARRFDLLMEATVRSNDAGVPEDILFETGSPQAPDAYVPLQHHFPKNYGIGPWGLPADASPERKMQALQFQAYLYLLDQQLLNFQSQLVGLRTLFSLENEDRTYFTQPVPGYPGVLFEDPGNAAAILQQAAEVPGSPAYFRRRNLFLDHLLARFSESFFDYASIDQPGTVARQQQLVDAKRRFLQDYPVYSNNRFNAYDYTLQDAVWDTDNTSGIEKRLGRLLGFENIRRRSLVNAYSVLRESNLGGVPSFQFDLIDQRTNAVLLRGKEHFTSAEQAERRLEDVYRYMRPGSFSSVVVNPGARLELQLKDPDDTVMAVGPALFDNAETVAQAIAAIVTLFTIGQADEGLFLVENLLLLPPKPVVSTDSPPASPPTAGNSNVGFLPVCSTVNGDEADVPDPYSFRVCVVLPAYSARFLNMDFRRFCEKTIRTEIPAHIYPRICWVSNEQLVTFESAYRSWLNVKAGITPDPANLVLERFQEILSSLRSIYPPAKLENCSNTSERKLFLLNQNALGTIKT